MTEYRLHHLTWPEVRDRLKRARVGVLALGATEQHGPHLKMGTDARIAERLAEKVVAAADGLALMAPPIPIGYSPHHMAFPGTLTARPETLRAVLDDLVDSLQHHGLQRFLLINGHGGNLTFLPAWASDVQRRTSTSLAIAHWSLVARDSVTELAASEVTGHACEVETSLAMALDRDLVHLDRLGGPAPVVDPAHPLLRGQAIPERAVGVFMPRPFEELTMNGALGNPSAADAAGGERLLQRVIARCVEFIEWLATHEPGAPPINEAWAE